MQQPKRHRTQTRLDDLRRLAEQSHREGWQPSRQRVEFDRWLTTNPDLIKPRAISSARSEFRLLADPRLAGALSTIWSIVDQKMAAQPAGTPLRFNHELHKICREILAHPDSIAAALRDLITPPRC